MRNTGYDLFQWFSKWGLAGGLLFIYLFFIEPQRWKAHAIIIKGDTFMIEIL